MQQDYVIGLNVVTDQAYVHAKVSLLSGRSVEVRQAISELVLDVMQQYIAAQPDLKYSFVSKSLKCQSRPIVKPLSE